MEQCLQSFPEHADELRPLLETALATNKVSTIQPRPEFREKAREQLYAALQGIQDYVIPVGLTVGGSNSIHFSTLKAKYKLKNTGMVRMLKMWLKKIPWLIKRSSFL